MRYFNVGVHDVTGGPLENLGEIHEFLAEIGVRKVTYLVVPNYHEDENLCIFRGAILNILGSQEIALHGYTHKGKRNWKYSHMRLFTNGEGEFVSHRDLADRVKRGLEILKSMGLKPEGFVPPAWLIKKRDIAPFRSTGLSFLNTRYFIHDLRNNRSHFSPVLTFSSRGLLETLSVKTYGAMSKMLKPFKIVRIAIHPGDTKVGIKRTLLGNVVRYFRTFREDIYFSDFLKTSGQAFPKA